MILRLPLTLNVEPLFSDSETREDCLGEMIFKGAGIHGFLV